MGLEGARVRMLTNLSSRSVLPVASSLVHLLALHGLLQDDLAALEGAARRGLGVGGHGLLHT
jgi:hypothetical protein